LTLEKGKPYKRRSVDLFECHRYSLALPRGELLNGVILHVTASEVSSMKESNSQPRGTIAILIIFAVMIVVLWGSVYLVLLFRGASQ